MKLWLLRPIDPNSAPGGNYWWDKNYGFVVRAESETDARTIAAGAAGDEARYYANPWTVEALVSCVELTSDGPAEIIIQDFAAG